jgi:hypothetical protein
VEVGTDTTVVLGANEEPAIKICSTASTVIVVTLAQGKTLWIKCKRFLGSPSGYQVGNWLVKNISGIYLGTGDIGNTWKSFMR